MQEPRQATSATQPLSDRRRDRAAVDRHSARGFEHRAERRVRGQRRQDLHAVLDGPDRDEARHDGRGELAAELVRSRHAPSVCVRDGPDQLVQRAGRAAVEGGTQRRVHGRPLRAGGRRRSRHPRGARPHDEQARVAPAVARDLLQRLGRDGRRPVVRRPQRRPAHGARQEQRPVSVGISHRRGREHHRDHVRLARRPAGGRARGRRRVRRRAARRRHLDVLAEGHDEVAARRRRATDERRARFRPGAPIRPGRRRARSASTTAASCTPRHASRVTASKATAATAAAPR